MIVKTDAIVLKTFDLRETSRIGVFFTRNYGKVKGVMKGIRKDPRKFGSNVDKFSLNGIVYYQYSKSDLHLISQCDLKHYFFPVRQDYRRNVAANYILELVDLIMPAEYINEKVYRLMLDYLETLQTVRDADIDKLIYIFQVKILLLSGFSPHLDSCVKCGRKVHGKVRFSQYSGGLICQDCPTQAGTFTIISRGTVASILHIEQNDWEKSLRLGLTASVRRELKYILNNFLSYHLERRIRATKYL